MEIRKKLTYQFVSIVAVILLFSLAAIYILFAESRKEEFYDRLSKKAILAAQMLIDIAEIDADLLRKIEKNNPLSLSNEKIIIYDYKNKVLFSSDEDSIIKISPDLINKVRLYDEIKLKQKPYEMIGQFYKGQYDRIVVFAAATDIYGMKKLVKLRFILLIVFIVSLAIVYFSGRIYAARALKPVSKIISEVDNISISNLNRKIDEGNGKDELAQLANTFNKMLQRLETAFRTQKNFIANASHELRTPLTILTGQLEVLLLKKRNTEEYHQTLHSILDEIKNLNHISDRLLLLAQTSSDFSESGFVPFRIDEPLWQAQTEITKRNCDYIVSINFSEKIDNDEILHVFGNDLLLKTAFGNLMENACKYSDNHKVDVCLDIVDDFIKINFSDSGFGISNDELKMIFQPFYRGKNQINIKGHGLGLSLVEKIVLLHKGTIEVESEVGKGSVFTIILPILN